MHSWVCRLQFPPWNDAHAALMWLSASPATKQHLWVPEACLQQTRWVCCSQEEKPSAKVVLKAAHCCHLPFKKIYASLSSCLLGCPQKHTFSLLAKALCSSVFYSASLSISSWLLGLVSDTMYFFFPFPLGFGISSVSLFYLSLLLPCLIHSSCGWLAGLPSLCIMLRILGFLRNMSKACGSLDGRGVWGRRVTYICMAKSLCFPSETITTLLIRYIPI